MGLEIYVIRFPAPTTLCSRRTTGIAMVTLSLMPFSASTLPAVISLSHDEDPYGARLLFHRHCRA